MKFSVFRPLPVVILTVIALSEPAFCLKPTDSSLRYSELPPVNSGASVDKTVQASAAAVSHCAGDCDGDNEVFGSEVTVALNIVAGIADLSLCDNADINLDGQLFGNEITTAINYLASGCPRESLYMGTANAYGRGNRASEREMGFGVFKSSDGAASWQPKNQGIDYHRIPGTDYVIGPQVVSALAVDPKSPQTLYLGTIFSGGIFKSTDGGGNWLPMSNGLPTIGGGYEAIYAVAIDPVDSQTIYAGMGDGLFGGVYKSTDGGAGWLPASQGLMNQFGTAEFVRALKIDPSHPQTLYALSGNYRRNRPGDGIYKSTDGGATWLASNDGMGAASEFIQVLAMDRTNPQILYVGTGDLLSGDGLVFKSTDGATSWVPMSNGLVSSSNFAEAITALAVDPVESQTVYAATAYGLVFKSADGGSIWRTTNERLGNRPIVDLVIDPTRPEIIYAGTYSNGIFKSTDGGTTWLPMSTGLIPGASVGSLILAPIDPSTPSP